MQRSSHLFRKSLRPTCGTPLVNGDVYPKHALMTEFRTTTPLFYSMQLLQAMGSAIRRINPMIEIGSEMLRREMEIRVSFTESRELDQFLDALAAKGIRLETLKLAGA